MRTAASASACCGEVAGPNSPLPGIGGLGGGRVGGVVVSRFVEPGTVNDTPYNHYALLRSLEDIFGLPHLGFAGAAGLKAFGEDVFNTVEGATDLGIDPAFGGATTTTIAATGDLAASGGGPPTGLIAVGIAAGLLGVAVRRRSTPTAPRGAGHRD